MQLVYFLEQARTGWVKVGHSATPDRRAASLQIGNPKTTTLLGCIPGGPAAERAIHLALNEWGAPRRGEWFEVGPEIRGHILAAIEEAQRVELTAQLEASCAVLEGSVPH